MVHSENICALCGKQVGILEFPYEISLRVIGNPAFPLFWICQDCGKELRKAAERGVN